MLVAVTEAGKYFSLGNRCLELEKLRQLRKTEHYYCPACKQEVILKLGTKQAWHFAHKPHHSCSDEAEGETSYHIEGKKLLYEWLRKQGLEVSLEPYLKEVKQRPDLLLKISNNIYAIEFQCAKIAPEIFLKRTHSYQAHHYTPIWILGGNQLKRIKGNFFQLNSFHWLFASEPSSEKTSLQLITFCPKNNTFILLRNMIAISANRAFCTPKFSKLANSSFKSLFQTNKQQYPSEVLLQIKANWRRPRIRLSQAELYLQKIYYQKSTPISLYPAEAGFPTVFSEFIETPSFIWQSWLLEIFIATKSTGEKFHVNLVTRALQSLIHKGIFQLRSIPLQYSGSLFLTIQNYLFFLAKLKILTTNDGQLFIKNAEIRKPRNVEEGLMKDKQVMLEFVSVNTYL
ncbi:competence protein CoiA family protein [Bacillaceae bacterium IKA-2]|nr:competence protein CoiA family protein [Bacillaceae bacterium IKA-2]